MNIDKFDIGTEPFEKTLFLRLPSTAMLDEHAANVLKEWNSPLLYAESERFNFYYDITGRVPLRTLLGKTLSKADAIHIFASVADAVLYAEENGVNPKYMILDSDLVFVSEESGSMRLVCVPAVNHGLAAKPLRAYIKELIVNMMYDENENLEYVGKIVNYLNKGKRLDVGEFLDFLDLLEGEASSVDEQDVITEPEPMVEAIEEETKFIPEPEKVPVVQEMFIPEPEVIPVAEEFTSFEPEIVAEAEEQPMFVPVPDELPISMLPTHPYFIRKRNGEKVIIDKEEFKVGKIPGMADYIVTDNPAISRMHAVIKKIDGAYYVCDNYSTNATYLNGEILEPGKNYILIDGARVNFANDEFTYYMD